MSALNGNSDSVFSLWWCISEWKVGYMKKKKGFTQSFVINTAIFYKKKNCQFWVPDIFRFSRTICSLPMTLVSWKKRFFKEIKPFFVRLTSANIKPVSFLCTSFAWSLSDAAPASSTAVSLWTFSSPVCPSDACSFLSEDSTCVSSSSPPSCSSCEMLDKNN